MSRRFGECFVFSSRGYVIIEAKSGEEAVEAVRKESPTLSFSMSHARYRRDRSMQGIRQSSDAPIIMLTVRNAERDKVLALDAGADDYVVKPFSIEDYWREFVLR